MTILRVGTNEKYADGWAAVFGKSSRQRTAKKSKTVAKAKPAKKQSVKQKTVKAKAKGKKSGSKK
jgi:hypothetical protein